MRARQLLRSLRTQAHLSLRAAASAAGVDAAALSRYENGHKMPRCDTLEHLVATCGYELDVRPARSTSARFIDALCEHQAQAILNDLRLVARTRDELPRLEGRLRGMEGAAGCRTARVRRGADLDLRSCPSTQDRQPVCLRCRASR